LQVLITGANGFVGKNLGLHLEEREDIEVLRFTRQNVLSDLPGLIGQADCVVHLAGVNRPEDPVEFREGNTDLTAEIARCVRESGRKVPVIYTSSIQAERDNAYGASKEAAERALLELHRAEGVPVHIFRLPNVFGKWARPNYNSAVATFCYSIAQDLSIQVNDPEAVVQLVYIDDVVSHFMGIIDGEPASQPYTEVEPVHRITVGELAEILTRFRRSRENLITEAVGEGLTRKLYATYVSYLPPERFTYTVPRHGDERGMFVEMLKTRDSGQFSFFTAHPGITRGGHYHHSKTEKFLVIKGQARFCFRHMVTGEFYELATSGDRPEIVETVPGWTHDITNTGEDELVCMLWANEIFDRDNPDTYACPLNQSAGADK